MRAMNISTEQFSDLMHSDRPLLVDFWAPWCSYCRRINAAYEKIAEQYGGRLTVAKVNIDEEPQLALEQQIDVIPTLILYKNGEAQGFVVAPESKAAIEAFIQESAGL